MRSSILSSTPVTERIDVPRPPGVLRRYWARHPWTADALVAGVYLALETLGTVFLVIENKHALWVVIVVAVLTFISTAAIVLRRHRPRTVYVVVGLASLIGIFVSGESDLLGVMFALYAIAVYDSSRAAWVAFGIASVVSMLTGWVREALGLTSKVAGINSDGSRLFEGWLSLGIQAAILLLIATLIGTASGNRKRYLGALVGRAAQLERELEQQSQLAAASERARIAREMHDVVAHSVTVMVALAEGAAAESERNPERARSAMLSTADAGRSALTELRRLLGVLHDDSGLPAELAPQPGFGELTALVESFRGAGLPVSLTVSGEAPAGDTSQLTVYRVVQEALTNALRYAKNPTAVEVVITSARDLVKISVTDDGESGESTSVGARQGILGLKKRVELFDGSVEAGPGAAGGWSLQATIPLKADS